MRKNERTTLKSKAMSLILTVVIIMVMCPLTTLAASSQLIPDGLYTLVPACAASRCLDIDRVYSGNGANAQIWSSNCLSSSNQRFYITHIGNNYYNIIVDGSGQALDVRNGSSRSGSNVQQYQYNNTNAQKWRFTSAGGGYFYISPRTNINLNLDVSGGYNRNGANVQVYNANGTAAQKWRLSRLIYSGQTSNLLYNSPMSPMVKTSVRNPVVFTMSNPTGQKATITIRGLYGTINNPYGNASLDATVVIRSSSGSTIGTYTFNSSSRTITVPAKYRNFTISISNTDHGTFFNAARGWGFNEATHAQLQFTNVRMMSVR